jgi:hypothetical protein
LTSAGIPPGQSVNTDSAVRRNVRGDPRRTSRDAYKPCTRDSTSSRNGPRGEFCLSMRLDTRSSCGAVARALLLSPASERLGRAPATLAPDDTRARRRGACRRPQPGRKRAQTGARGRPSLDRPERGSADPCPPGRPSGHARLSDDDGPPRPGATPSGCSISASRRRRHGRPQPAAGAPSSPARRPDRLADYMGYYPHRRTGHMRCATRGAGTSSGGDVSTRGPPRRPDRAGGGPAPVHGVLQRRGLRQPGGSPRPRRRSGEPGGRRRLRPSRWRTGRDSGAKRVAQVPAQPAARAQRGRAGE